MARELSLRLIALRRNHPAWLLVASRNAPLILSCLKTFFDAHPTGANYEDAIEQLAESFADFANDSDFDLGDDLTQTARRELRHWIKRALVVERDGQLLATDALQRALHFLDSLHDDSMTSTASRLATVQRAIENLELQLSQSQSERARSLSARIESLTKELAAVNAGEFNVLDGIEAEEGIREVYQLAISLQADFRRVEDSYREADRDLRQRIINERQNRGQVVDELLDSHERLIRTVEGQVFESFHHQLVKSAELEEMKRRLRAILANANTDKALQRKQKAELRQLVSHLVQESERVIQARARSERDVRSFLTSGLADEQMRVGAMLQDVLQVALDVDWQSQRMRRSYGPLPPIAIATPHLPLIERLLVKQIDGEGPTDLDLTVNEADPAEMDEEFWQAYRALDRTSLFKATLAVLRAQGAALRISDLATLLPPTHDLETLAYWLAMARQAGVEIDDERESIDLYDDRDGSWTRFLVPLVELAVEESANIDSGSLE